MVGNLDGQRQFIHMEDNKALVLQFYKGFDDRRMEDSMNLLAPDFKAYMAGLPEALDSEGFRQFGMAFYIAFSQGQHIFDEVIVADNKVVTCGQFEATHLGEFQGLPPTGKRIKLAVMHIDRVENGKIVEHWGQGDALGLMQQLGIVFLPGPTLLPKILKGAVSKVWKKK
jgi:predicted ester cyclase